MQTMRPQLMLFIIMICLAVTVQAEVIEQNFNTDDATVKLTIKPHICVAPRGEISCISRIDVFWESSQPTDLCLYVSQNEQSLHCWQQQQGGEFQHHVTLVRDLEYWLASVQQNTLLAKSMVKFAALQPHRKHNRRRNILPWSIQSL